MRPRKTEAKGGKLGVGLAEGPQGRRGPLPAWSLAGGLRAAPPPCASVAWHTEDEARAVLGEVGLRLVEPRLHGDGALLPVQAALHRVGDVDLQVALLTGRTEKKTGG